MSLYEGDSSYLDSKLDAILHPFTTLVARVWKFLFVFGVWLCDCLRQHSNFERIPYSQHLSHGIYIVFRIIIHKFFYKCAQIINLSLKSVFRDYITRYRVTHAPFCIRRLMIFTCPFSAARWSAVSPSQSDSFMILGPSLLFSNRLHVL